VVGLVLVVVVVEEETVEARKLSFCKRRIALATICRHSEE
jgi:hypothetical protein